MAYLKIDGMVRLSKGERNGEREEKKRRVEIPGERRVNKERAAKQQRSAQRVEPKLCRRLGKAPHGRQAGVSSIVDLVDQSQCCWLISLFLSLHLPLSPSFSPSVDPGGANNTPSPSHPRTTLIGARREQPTRDRSGAAS